MELDDPHRRPPADAATTLQLNAIAAWALRRLPVANGVTIVAVDSGLAIVVGAAGVSLDHLGRMSEIDRTATTSASLGAPDVVICDDVDADPRIEVGVRADPRIRSLATVALPDEGTVLAVIVVTAGAPAAFGDLERAEVRALMAPLTTALAHIIDRPESPADDAADGDGADGDDGDAPPAAVSAPDEADPGRPPGTHARRVTAQRR